MSTNTRRILRTVVAAAVIACVSAGSAVMLGGTPASTATNAAAQTSIAATAATKPGTVLAALATLHVAGKASAAGYSRAQFGPAWKDIDGNGISTRNDILIRDLTSRTYDQKTHRVLTGTLADLYTGRNIVASQPGQISKLIQIDHVVPLKEAFVTGAQQISADARLHLANDPLNLLAADATSNMAKGDGDAATWLPKNKAFRCDYVGIQVAVKAKYHLWVTQAEHDAIARVLTTGRCESELLPSWNAR